MSQLHSFLNSLNAEEIQRLKQVRLIGKEEALFKTVQTHLHKKLPAPDEICELLEISSNHLYKINSVLLNKFYDILIPAGGIQLLEYLKQKGHFVLLKSEAGTQEKKLIKLKAGKTVLAKFYLALFHLFIDFPFSFYDKKSVQLYGKKYLGSLEKKTVSDELYIKYHLLFADVNRCAGAKNPVRALGTDFKKELSKAEELKKGKHFLALYYLCRAAASWYSYYEKDGQKKLEWLSKAMELKNNIAWFFEIDISVFLNLLYADALFMEGETEKAEQFYDTVFEKGLNENMYGYYYFCEQFALLKIISGKLKEAKVFIEKIFSPCIERGLDIYATRGTLAFAKLYLAERNVKDSIQYIHQGFSINEKSFYLPFDLQLRVLENISFLLKKDYEFALKLARRNLKFTESQKDQKLLKDYFVLWNSLIEFIRQVKKGKSPSKEILESLSAFDNRYKNLYCGLISSLYE